MAWPRPDLPINQQEISPNDLVTWMNEMVLIPAANRPQVVASNPPPNMVAATGGATYDKGGFSYNVMTFGAKLDGQFVADAAMTSGLRVITSASGKFTAADVGKLLACTTSGAANVAQVGTVTGFTSPTQIQASFTAGATVSNALVLWATDDTAAWTAAFATKGRIEFPKGYSGISAALTSPDPIGIIGAGSNELFGSLPANLNSWGFPANAPFLSGSVLWQFGTAVDGIRFTGAGISPTMRDFGILFCSLWSNTGHGINIVPPADGANLDMGITGGTWDGIKIFGHDGNHYGFRSVNPIYDWMNHLRSYGGGGLFMRGDTVRGSFGNVVVSDFYSMTVLSGTAHGVRLEANTSGTLNILTFIRPQAWTWNPTVPIPGTTPPTAAQSCLSCDTNVAFVDFFSPDWESNVGSTATMPIAGARTLGGFGASYGYVTAMGISPNFASEHALLIYGASASQSADVVRVFDYNGGKQILGLHGIVYGSGLFYLRAQDAVVFTTPYTPDATSFNTHKMTLTASITVNAPTFTGGLIAGLHQKFIWTFSGAGGWVITYNAIFKTGGGAAIVTTTGTVTIDDFEYDGTAFRLVSRITGQTV